MSYYGGGGYGGGGYGGGGFGSGGYGGGNQYGSNFGGGQYGNTHNRQNYGSSGYGGYGGIPGNNGRETNWCPSGYGGPLYCPSTGYEYDYNHCCSTFLWFGSGCCYTALSVWNIILIVIGCLLLLGLCGFATCWCMPNSPLNRRSRARRNIQQQQHQQQPKGGIVHYEQEPFRHY
uniref:Uncharacterized protein n=1 Tax=Panagrolaimus davidi TaxID=227884 RepID=A0A914Q0T1_9BILA